MENYAILAITLYSDLDTGTLMFVLFPPLSNYCTEKKNAVPWVSCYIFNDFVTDPLLLLFILGSWKKEYTSLSLGASIICPTSIADIANMTLLFQSYYLGPVLFANYNSKTPSLLTIFDPFSYFAQVGGIRLTYIADLPL